MHTSPHTSPVEASTRAPDPPRLALPVSRRRYGGFLLSVLLHLLVLVVTVRSGERIWSRTLAPGDPARMSGGGGGGSGGSIVAYITLPPAPEPMMPRPPVVATPVIRPPVEADPTPVPTPLPTPAPATILLPTPVDTQPSAPATGAPGQAPGAAAPGAGGGTGGGRGSGIGPGQGSGAGPGNGGGGAGGVVRPPELRDLAFPFDTPPKALRGASLAVTFWVRVDGMVDRYEVDPTIGDRDYARKFDEVIRAFRFTPARAPDGSRVAGTTTVTFTLPGKRSS